MWQLVDECACGYAAEMRNEVSDLVGRGMTKDEILSHYIAKYGSQEPLAVPLDEGFNRLAWFFPYLMGVVGAAVVGVSAFRWSNRKQGVTEAPIVVSDVDRETRLENELRNLD